MNKPSGVELQPRRVLIVTDEMEVGGSQRQIANLLKGLDRSRWQPELLYFRQRSFLVDQLEAGGVRTHYLPKRSRIDPVFLLHLHALLRDGRYVLVHAFSLTAELWIRALLPFVSKMKFVASVRGLCLGYPRWQWQLKRWVLRRADAVVANARSGARATALRATFPLERIDVIPNGVDIPTLLAAAERAHERERLGLPVGRAFALFVGRLVVEKNLPLLLTALARISVSNRPMLVLAGDGPLRETLQVLLQQLGLEHDVSLLGERRDAVALMMLADFLVLPSSEEGLSNVLLEAMAAGCPVIASDVGGNPELVTDGLTGLLFRAGDPQGLVAAIKRLADDTTLRTQLGAAARKQAISSYAVATMVAGTDSVYARVLDEPALPIAAVPGAGESSA